MFLISNVISNAASSSYFYSSLFVPKSKGEATLCRFALTCWVYYIADLNAFNPLNKYRRCFVSYSGK